MGVRKLNKYLDKMRDIVIFQKKSMNRLKLKYKLIKIHFINYMKFGEKVQKIYKI